MQLQKQTLDNCKMACRPGKLLVTVAVLGRQKLTVLRDTIKCEADANFTKNKTGRPSACLYLEVCSLSQFSEPLRP